MIAPLHNLLVVEDDPATARILADFGRSIGMAVRIAATLEEVDAALAEEEFCCVLLDKQIPFSAGALALTSTGDTAQKRIRARDARRNAADQHVLPILVVSGAAADLAATAQASFISRNLRDGATGYIPKPFDAETVTSEILAALERAGRVDHAVCGTLRPPALEAVAAPPAPEAPVVSGPLAVLMLDGVRVGRRMTFLVNGKRRDLQDAHFITLLVIAAERARGSEAYVPGREAGTLRSPEIPSRIRTVAADAVPKGFSIVQVHDGGIRLHPLVAVAGIAWEVFERAANPVMQAVAGRERKRRAG